AEAKALGWLRFFGVGWNGHAEPDLCPRPCVGMAPEGSDPGIQIHLNCSIATLPVVREESETFDVTSFLHACYGQAMGCRPLGQSPSPLLASSFAPAFPIRIGDSAFGLDQLPVRPHILHPALRRITGRSFNHDHETADPDRPVAGRPGVRL